MEETTYTINDQFRIEFTKNNFTLQEYVKSVAKKDSSERKQGDVFYVWADCGHYMGLKGALKAFVNKFADKATNEESLLKRFDELETLFASLGEK
jgi:hypothetical protein